MGVARGNVFGRYATPLPSALAAAASWDLDVAAVYGARIGRELHDMGFNMTLGGGVDLTREPRNGRNFEYQGEDPILAGKMDGAMMKAEQAQGVIGDIKHYAMNDQENGRNFVNIIIGKRAMRETDLLAFEIAVRESDAGAVMCSYNLVNGDYACENDYLLNEVLKKDFGFKGFVLSDWGGTHSTVKAANAGLDMEQPGSDFFGEPLKKAVAIRRGLDTRGWTTWSIASSARRSRPVCSMTQAAARCPIRWQAPKTRSSWPNAGPCCSATNAACCHSRPRA